MPAPTQTIDQSLAATDAGHTQAFNAMVKAHKKELAAALREVMRVADDHKELYTETGALGVMVQMKAVAEQFANQIDPPPTAP